LTTGARRFLLLAFALLIAGVFAVIFAPTITASDIGSTRPTIDERLKQTEDSIQAATSTRQEIADDLDELAKMCSKVMLELFAPWPLDGGIAPDDHTFHVIEFTQFPTADQIADGLAAELQNPRRAEMKLLGIQLKIQGCSPSSVVSLIKSPGEYGSIVGAIRNKPISFDRDKFKKLRDLDQKLISELNFKTRVRDQQWTQKIAAAASGSNEAPDNAAPVGETNLTIRLIQTSITRFGLLAVIGFFVALLVSLYRYNVRLAAYYMARADFFRIFGDDALTTSETSAIMTALTPGIEFGKIPATPAMQILELLKSAKKD
jgi:hypothetical protein